MSNLNKPTKEALEADLKAGMSGPAIAKKYGCANPTVHKWIKDYGLQDLQAVRKPKGEPIVVNTPPSTDMIPTQNEIEQFHTDRPAQELLKVEMDQPSLAELLGDEYELAMDKAEEATPAPLPGCFSGYNPELYYCNVNDCKYKVVCLTMFRGLNPEPQGMTEEENMTDAEWEANVTEAYKNGAVATEPAPRETFDEIWQDVRDDLKTLERLYIAEAKVKAEVEAKKSFRERLGTLLDEVVGES